MCFNKVPGEDRAALKIRKNKAAEFRVGNVWVSDTRPSSCILCFIRKYR